MCRGRAPGHTPCYGRMAGGPEGDLGRGVRVQGAVPGPAGAGQANGQACHHHPFVPPPPFSRPRPWLGSFTGTGRSVGDGWGAGTRVLLWSLADLGRLSARAADALGASGPRGRIAGRHMAGLRSRAGHSGRAACALVGDPHAGRHLIACASMKMGR
jgi:hypothetical protein